jgi:hypothetical protein
MKDNLLAREVKRDSKGLFIFYGGWRYHPSKSSWITMGMRVTLESPFRRNDEFAFVWVKGRKEVWMQRGKPKNEVPFFSKRIRLTDHCAGIRPACFGGYLELVRC